LCYASSTVVSDSLFGDVAAALREHGSATLDEHCCYFLRPGCVLVGGHRDLRSLGITDCPVTAMTVTRCDGRKIAGVRYPPFWSAGPGALGDRLTVPIVILRVERWWSWMRLPDGVLSPYREGGVKFPQLLSAPQVLAGQQLTGAAERTLMIIVT
jgi:hypothetical protein